MAPRACVVQLALAGALLLAPASADAAYRDVPVAVGQARLRVLLRRRDAAVRPLRLGRAATTAPSTLAETGKGKRIKVTDTVRDPKAKVLAYGRTTKFGSLRCTSRRSRHHLPEHALGPRLHRLRRKAAGVLSHGRRQWVYDFAEGSKDMRDLLGGKGANVAEMTRVLGADRVPAGFTITTEACVAYMKADQDEPDGMAEQVADALERLQEHTGKRLGDDEDPLLVSVRSGARESMPGMLDTVLNLGLNDTLGRGPRHAPPRTSASPGTPTGASCRCSATSRRGIDGEAFEQAISEGQGGPRGRGGHRPRRRRAEGAHRPLQGALPRAHGRGLPAGPAGAAAARDPRGLRLLDRRARHRVPAHQPHPRRVGHGGQRPADGLRQQGRHLRLRRRLQPRRGHRRARAQRRLPPQRPGRGRRLRRAHAARHPRDEGLAARGLRAADGHPQDAREALRGHAGHRVHGGGRAALHAPDAQRQAARPRPPCASRATPSRKGCSTATRR